MMRDLDGMLLALKGLAFAARAVDLTQIGYWPPGMTPPHCLIVTEPDRSPAVMDWIEWGVRTRLNAEATAWRRAFQTMTAALSADTAPVCPQMRGSRGQPWLIVDIADGGLDRLIETASEGGGVLVTCSAVQHHGVLRLQAADSAFCALTTGRAPGQDWNLSEDFGHEGAHAGFGQIPLFSQRLQQMTDAGFGTAIRGLMTEREIIGLLCYAASEILVWFIRNEEVPTESGLRALRTISDLEAFVNTAAHLGYDNSGLIVEDLIGRLKHGEKRTCKLAALCWRIQHKTRLLLECEEAPNASEWKSLLA